MLSSLWYMVYKVVQDCLPGSENLNPEPSALNPKHQTLQEGLTFPVYGLGCRPSDTRKRIGNEGEGFGLGFQVQGVQCRVKSLGFSLNSRSTCSWAYS